MRTLRIPAPAALERTLHPLALGAGLAELAQRVDVLSLPGRIARAKGQSRAQNVTGSATTVTSAGVFRRADCRLILVDGSLAGTIRAHPAGSGQAIGPGCNGPVPECTEVFHDPEVPCNEGLDCETPADTTGGPYDIDLVIASVQAGQVITRVKYDIERYVRACVGAADGKIHKPSKVRIHCENQTSYCVLVQFVFTVEGLGCGATLGYRGTGDGASFATANANGTWALCFFCHAGVNDSEFHMDFAVQGQAVHCGQLVRLSNFRAAYRCSNGSPDLFCDGSTPAKDLSGCSACP